MRTSLEIRDYVEHKMTGMIKYPRAWSDTAMGLETQYMNMLGLVLFINETHTDRIITDWCRFAHHEIGYSGAHPVSVWLEKNGKLDDDWKELTRLLSKFKDFITFVPVPA